MDGDVAVLFIIDDETGLTVTSPDLDVAPKAGQRIIYLGPGEQGAEPVGEPAED